MVNEELDWDNFLETLGILLARRNRQEVGEMIDR